MNLHKELIIDLDSIFQIEGLLNFYSGHMLSSIDTKESSNVIELCFIRLFVVFNSVYVYSCD